MSPRIVRAALGALGVALSCVACEPTREECPNGEQGCECKAGKRCDSGFVCVDSVCVEGSGGAGEGGGAGPTCTGYPSEIAVAELEEALGAAPKTQFPALFSAEGRITSLDTTACAPTVGLHDPHAKVQWMTCLDAYDCGGCEIWYGYFAGDATNPESFWLVGDDAGPSQCAPFVGFYRLEAPDTVADPSGGSAGDPCGDCLASCQGLPSCCTGSGCACQGACAPAGCSSGSTLCCGPYGDCICSSNCPY